jgi:hypothetical protein
MAMACGVRPTPPRSASLLELGGDRGLIGSFREILHPQLEPVGENKMRAAGTAIDHLASLSLDLRDVLGADVTVGVDPHGGDAGGAKVVFCEEFVARWPNAMRS